MPEPGPIVTTAESATGPWSPLRVRLFRSLWIAGLVSNIGTFMHTVAAGWSITDLTRSPTLVSLVQTAWTVPGFLLALLAGALADVLDRRRLMITTQLASMVIAATLGAFELSHHLTVPLLLLFTFLLSTAGTLAAPAFMAVTPELVDRSELPKAIGLNSISTNIAQSAGPALAGIVIAISGPGAVFLVNAASFLGIVLVVRQWHPTRDTTLPAEHIGAAMRTGVRYVRNSPRLQLLALRLILSITATSALAALLPIVARGRLGVSAGQFGLLSTATGAGAVAAVWVLPRLNRVTTPDIVACIAAAVWAVGTAVFAIATALPIALCGLLLTGAGAMATMNVLFSMYTVLLPSWIRGRASSVAMLTVWLGASVGAVAWGALAANTSAGTALLFAAGGHVAVTLLATIALPIGQQDDVDITQVTWAMPELQIPPSEDAGPVLITIDWLIDPASADDFAAAMIPVRRQRRRDGAYNWGLFHDLEAPGRMVETYYVSTWSEHERQHHRATAADDLEQSAARALLVSGGTQVHHHIAPPRPKRLHRSIVSTTGSTQRNGH
jgi:MFS family permease